jgi:hypothetical protein
LAAGTLLPAAADSAKKSGNKKHFDEIEIDFLPGVGIGAFALAVAVVPLLPADSAKIKWK